MKIIIDTNFIVTAVKQKIDLFSKLDEIFGIYKPLIAKQTIDELKKISENKKLNLKQRQSAELAIKIIYHNKKINLIDLKTPDVDAGILRYVAKNKVEFIATLDRSLKKEIRYKNPKIRFLTIKQKKRVEVLE